MEQLVIGNKNYSSWSLRPWLLLKQLNIPFEEIKVPLYQEDTREQLLKYSASAKVPVLLDNSVDLTIWDSLAICEYIADKYPQLPCWPDDIQARALARSISNEMHSSFFAIRNTLPMNCRASMVFKKITNELQADIDRICDIWKSCRAKYQSQGDFLLGQFSIADVMYAPVVLRFNSYGIAVGDVEKAYMNSILDLAATKEWIAEGIVEKEIIADGEVSPE